MTQTTAQHLWDFEHPYYCETSQWCEHQGHNLFESWADFTETAFYDGDRDQNFLVRWDWHADEDELALFFVLQRKPIFATCRIPVTADDEPAVRVWLAECAKTMVATWAPFLDGPATA